VEDNVEAALILGFGPPHPQQGKGFFTLNMRLPVFWIRIRIHRIHMFLGLPDPDPIVRGMDPDPDPNPSIMISSSINSKKNS
jgi:hypothetical protein